MAILLTFSTMKSALETRTITTPLEEIEALALQLPVNERIRLTERLLESLSEDERILVAWVYEAERRVDALERGEIGTIDFDESLERIKASQAQQG